MIYNLVLINASPTDQLDNPGDELFDALPAELTVLTASASAGTATVDAGANAVSWNGSIPGDGSVDLTIEAQINPGTGDSTVTNQATIFFDGDGNGTNESSVPTDDPSVVGSSDPTTDGLLRPSRFPL
ncbi:MAG: DUF11 domain-containing protein [Deltaproteobacteria bacterium]|nr:DUF11 domain-containing protein [Deltaproteobacteria bacterium]